MFPSLGFLFELFEAVNYFRKKMNLWKDFLRNNEFSCGDVCSLLRIMFSILVTLVGWRERTVFLKIYAKREVTNWPFQP